MFHLERTTYRLNGFLLVTEDDFSHIYCSVNKGFVSCAKLDR